MPLLRKLWILSMVLFVSTVSSQYTGVINSNRPGFSESPYSVGKGIYQLETSIFYRKTDPFPTFSRPESLGIEFLFRTSFFKEKLEFNLNFAYQRGEIHFENIFSSSYYATGIRNLTIGAKYLIYEQEYTDKSKEVRSWKERHRFDWKRLIPSVAAYAGVNTGVGNELFYLYDQGGFSPKAGILLQNDLTSDLNVVTNVFYDRFMTDAPELSYIITATYSLNDRWSTFFENQTISNKFRTETNLGSGFAYLWNRNIQVNSSLRFIVDGTSKGIYSSVGVSYRLDRHADDFVEVDEFGNPLEEYVEEKSGKGFFGRMWGKITGIFKKKSKKTGAKQIKLKQKSIESIQNNTNVEESTINNDTLKIKEPKPIRTRPQRVRVKPTKYKPVKGEKKGGFLGIFGKKSKKDTKEDKKKEAEKIKNMSQKDIDKELKKLEKEQRKLEKKQKKEEEKRKREEAKKKKKEDKKKKKDDEKKEGNG